MPTSKIRNILNKNQTLNLSKPRKRKKPRAQNKNHASMSGEPKEKMELLSEGRLLVVQASLARLVF